MGKDEGIEDLEGSGMHYITVVHDDGLVEELGHSECMNTMFHVAARTLKQHGVNIVKVRNCPTGAKAMVLADAADLIPFTVRIAGCAVYVSNKFSAPDPTYRDYVSLVEDFAE